MSQNRLEQLAASLASTDEEERYAAVMEAARSSQQEMNQILISALGDVSWRVRKAAVATLDDRLADDATWDVIIAGLNDGENAGHRTAALEMMERLANRLEPRIIELTRDPSEAMRKFAVDVLAVKPHLAAVDALLERLDDPDANVRGVAVEALSKIDDPRSINALTTVISTLKQRDPLEGIAALRGLIELRARVERSFVEPLLQDPLARSHALRLLARCPEREILPQLLAALDGNAIGSARAAVVGLFERYRDNPTEAEAISSGLADSLDRARPALLAVYRTADEVMVEAVLTLAELVADPELCAGLFEQRCSRWVEHALRRVMLSCGPQGALTVAQRLAKMEPDDQRVAIDAIAEAGDARSAALVAELLKNATGRVAESALHCLGRIGGAEHCQIVSPGLEDKDETIATAALDALRSLSQRFREATRLALQPWLERDLSAPASIRSMSILAEIATLEDMDFLRGGLTHPEGQVRAYAVRGLGQLDLEAAALATQLRIALADEVSEVRLAGVESLATEPSAEVVTILQRALSDSDARVRAAIVERMTELSPTEALPRLMITLSASDNEACAAVRASRFLSVNDRTKLLERACALPDGEVLREVARILPLLQPQEIPGWLDRLLEDTPFEVRHAAVSSCLLIAEKGPELHQELITRLRHLLEREQDPFVKETAEALVAQLGAAQA